MSRTGKKGSAKKFTETRVLRKVDWFLKYKTEI